MPADDDRWGRHRLQGSRRFWDEALALFTSPITPVSITYGPGRPGEPLGLSNRMYGTVSAILLGLAAGARVEVDARIVADLHQFDPPEDVLAAILPRASSNTSARGIVFDHRARTAHHWTNLAAWRPTNGFSGLISNWRPRTDTRLVMWSGEWAGNLLLNKTRLGGLHSLHEMVIDSGAGGAFDAVAALLYRPKQSLADAVGRIVNASMPKDRTLTMHVRSEIIFMHHNKEVNLTVAQRLAERAEVYGHIARCALKRAAEFGLTHVFLAGDTVAGARNELKALAERLRTAGLVVTSSQDLSIPRGVSAAHLDSQLLGHGTVCLTTLGSSFSDIATTRSRCAKYVCTSCAGPLQWRAPVFPFWMSANLSSQFLTPQQLSRHPSRHSADEQGSPQRRRGACAWFQAWGGSDLSCIEAPASRISRNSYAGNLVERLRRLDPAHT
jgi:hypothetical protein